MRGTDREMQAYEAYVKRVIEQDRLSRAPTPIPQAARATTRHRATRPRKRARRATQASRRRNRRT